MVKAFGKKESKRMTCHKKYKIRKKVREHNKKLAKTLKTTVNKKKKRGDGHIPNLAPFKEDLLLEAVQQTEAKKDLKLKNKSKLPLVVIDKKQDGPKKLSPSTVSYQLTIAQCNALLWIIDIRSAKECFCDNILSEILNQNKTVIFILNKIDLVPQSVVHCWYSFYSKKAPTFVFKSTQILLSDCEQIIPAVKQKLSRFGGARPLLSSLKSSFSQETSIGVIGTPKVGKSSVISSILKCCGRTTAKNANLTKLNDNIKLATIPGVINTEYKGMLSVLQNINSYMNQPSEVLTAMLQFISKEDAMYQFTLPDYVHPEGFLDALAIRYNLVHNKEPDHEAVGRLILKQLRDQKLKFYVEGEVISPDVEIPADVWQDVSKFIYTGDALKINSSEINIVLKKKEKKKKSNDMDVDEDEIEDDDDLEEDENESSVDECSDIDDDLSNEEIN